MGWKMCFPSQTLFTRSLSSTPAVVRRSPASPYSSSPPSLLSLEAKEEAEAVIPSFGLPSQHSSQGSYSPTAPPFSSWWPCSGPPLTQPSSGASLTSSSCSPLCRYSGCSPACQRPPVGQLPSQVTWPCISTQPSPPLSPLHGFDSWGLHTPPIQLPIPSESTLLNDRMAVMCRHSLLGSDQADLATLISTKSKSNIQKTSAPPCHRYILALPLASPSQRGLLLVVGCNPSTADASHDDPTLAKLSNWARFNGYSHLAVVNLFSYRETSPRKMKAAGVLSFLTGGDEADMWIGKAASISDDIVLAMGDIAFKSWVTFNHPSQTLSETGKARRAGARLRLADVVALIKRRKGRGSRLFAFCVTKSGNPGHVLYLPNSLKSREKWVDITDQ